MSRRHASLSIPLAVALAAAAAGCGGSDDDTSSTTVAPVAAAEATTSADVMFAQGMIVHHEQAIEMAEIAIDPNVGARAEVVDLATRIRGAQGPEVETLTAWLSAAGEPAHGDMPAGHDMSSMGGMMAAEEIDALAAMTGAEFDRTWLEMMIAHHEGAITESEAVIADGSDPGIAALADQIIAAQRAEISEMQALLDG